MTNNRTSNNPLAGVIGLLVMLVIFYLLFKVVSGIVSLLYSAGWILLIIALVLNYTVVFDYVKWLGKVIKTDTLRGVAYSALSIIGYPFVSVWLFLKAFLKYRINRNSKQREKAKEKEFTAYEEIEEEDDFLELPDLDAPKKKVENRYDDLFE